MAGRIRAHAWEKSQLGSVDQWPLELLAFVNLMLASREIMTVIWGPDRLMIYNDAYITQLGPRHPMLGRPLREVWPDVVDQISSLIDPAFQEGKASYLDDTPLTVIENGQGTERFYSASFEPIWVHRGTFSAVQGIFLTAMNNTAKIQAERKQRASEAKANQVLQSIGDAVIVTDAEMRVTQLNSVAQQLTGWLEQDALGIALAEVFRILHADTREPVESPADRARQFDGPVFLPHDTVLVARDGEERYINDSAAPIRNDEGVLTGIVLVFRDVTAQRQSQRAKERAAASQNFLLKLTDAQRAAVHAREIMRLSAEMLGRYLDVGRVGYAEASPDGKSMSFETGWAQGKLQTLSGSVPMGHWSENTSTEFSHGRTVVYPDVRKELSLRDEVQNYDAVGAVSVVAVPLLRSGVWRGSLYVNDPQPRAWVTADVSLIEEVALRTSEAMERAQAEEELKALADRLGMAQRAGRMASWQWDLATGLFIWDGGSEWIYGRPPSAMTHIDVILTYLYESDRDKVRRDVIPAMEGTGEYQSEFRVVWPDGSLHWIQAFGRTVWGPDGRPAGIVGININVTEQKRAEAALMQTEKLTAVGRLASTMAHEINNPLEAVTNLLYLARHSSNLEEAHPFLETADAELRRVAAITSQALRFHKQATRPTLCSFEELTRDLFKGRHSRLSNVGATVEQRDRTSHPVLCFEGEIHQVLNNLVANAIDALSGTGGKIFLRGRNGTDWETGRTGVVITVADTGSGMAQATRLKLFDAFFTTKGDGGTGLGLWVSKEIVARHDGRVHLRSSQRKGCRGTAFTVFLPDKAALRELGE